MKKSIAIIVVLLVSICAFAGNKKPVTKTDKPPVKIEKIKKCDKPILKPAKPLKVAKK